MTAANDEAAGADPLYDEAVWLVVSEDSASVSLLIERLKIGGELAARYLSQMQGAGIVPPAGSEFRILGGLFLGIREMLISAWRAFLTLTAEATTPEEGAAAAERVWPKVDTAIESTCRDLTPETVRIVRMVTDRERDRLARAYRADHAGFRRMIGAPPHISEAPPTPAAPAPARAAGITASSIGGTVVRTAVRATVWEAVWALFRGR